MPLERIDLNPGHAALPTAAEALVRDAEDRIDVFQHRSRRDPLAAFVASDFRLSFRALDTILAQHLVSGRSFCEWGSGFGVTTLLAATLGFDACGIEIERDLVDEARQLAEDHRIEATFVDGSFIPEAGEDLAETTGDLSMLATGYPAAYEELGLEVEDFDLIYAYPWPGEEETVERLFARFAAHGALLVTYRGMHDLQVHRKVRR